MLPKLAITMGDINGVGPEILAKALAYDEVWATCVPCVVGDPEIFEKARAFAPNCPPARLVSDFDAEPSTRDCVSIVNAGFPAPPPRPGEIDAEAGRCAVEWIKYATNLVIAGRAGAIVTCPISKEGIHRAGCKYAGHTELIADMTNSPDYRMCLFAGKLRIVHITSHMALREAIEQVKAGRIASSVRIGCQGLKRLGIKNPKIAVAGLNPHAGEAGAFGEEEINDIIPAIEACRAEGIDCTGPYPADTIFRRAWMGEFDLVIALYHDQGHSPAKLVAMDEGVNVTLGISIIRTSVDHGTAYDIAWKGQARENSLLAAINLAACFAGENKEGK
jgi:4-hydroxythreonine-4-phosphate dehydrogenase